MIVAGTNFPHAETIAETSIVDSGASLNAGFAAPNTADSKVDFSYSLNVGFCCGHSHKMRARSARFNSVAVGSKHR